MQFPNSKKILFLAGNKNIRRHVSKIFDKKNCDFLAKLSEEILKNSKAKKHNDLVTFAFWIRKKNIHQIKLNYENEELRFGHGLTFHVAPANIALNFAYSFVLSLLAGNSNIVRVSSNRFEQNYIFFKILNKIFKIKKFKTIKENNLFLTYDYDEDITGLISKSADCRVVWGSDKTVKGIKKIETQASCKEVIFPDRYSISLFNLNYLSKAKDSEIEKLTRKIYLDTLIFDQNACSSPHLIIWSGNRNEKKYKKFWSSFRMHVEKGKLFVPTEKKMFDKFTKLCELAAQRDEIGKTFQKGFLNVTELKKIPQDIDKFRVGNGYFFEFFVKNLESLKININKKIQTMTYLGFTIPELKKFLSRIKPLGIDRVVPVGRGLEFDRVWDGYDLIRSFSKIIDIK